MFLNLQKRFLSPLIIDIFQLPKIMHGTEEILNKYLPNEEEKWTGKKIDSDKQSEEKLGNMLVSSIIILLIFICKMWN